MRRLITLTLCVWLGAVALAASTKVNVKVTDHRMSEVRISPYIFGNFVEAGFGRQVSGMWSEMIYNRSFQVPGSYPVFGDVGNTTQWWMFPAHMYNENAPFWHSGYEEQQWELTDKETMGMYRTHGTESFKGLSSLILHKSVETVGGLRQKGLYMEAGKSYRFTLTAGSGSKVSPSLPGFTPVCKEEQVTRPLVMTLRDEQNPDRILFTTSFPLRGVQQAFECVVPDLQFTGRASIELTFDWKGSVALSCCSLMPDDNIKGWRKDVVERLKEIRVPVIRYPGGCYASFYDWRKYVGHRDTRETTTSFYWGGLDDNDASIDEFLQLCDLVGCEPQICINMMSSTPFKAAEFVEYLNGDDASAMGRFRQENGVTRTRKVRLFEMDNEAGRKWSALEYARQVASFGKAMKAVDKDIKLMMMGYSFNYEFEYLDQMLEIAGPYIDFVIQRDGSPEFVHKVLAKLRAYNRTHGTDIKLTNTEWLANCSSPEPFEDPEIPQKFGWRPQLMDSYKKVLSYRQIHWFYALNGASQLLDYLSYGGEYYLANFNNCVNTWGQNVIEASKETSWLSPMGEVFKFFAQQDERFPLQSELQVSGTGKYVWKTEAEVNDTNVEFPLIVNRESQTELYKVQACETDEGIHLYFVNKATEPVRLNATLPKGYKAERMEILSAPNRLSRSFATGSDIKYTKRKLRGTNSLDIPSLSLTRIVVKKR